MKKGKVLTNPLIRSVLRHAFPRKEEQALSRDGAFLLRGEDGAPAAGACMNTTVYGGSSAEALAFYRSFNGALASGILPERLLLSLTLPLSETEPVLNARMAAFKRLSERENLAISGGHTAFSDQISAPVLTAVISGRFAPGYETGEKALPGMDLVMTGFCGEAGASVTAEEEKAALS